MFSFLKKDLLVLWRDRKEVLIALFAPILLVVILNFAFSDIGVDDPKNIDLSVAIVMEDDAEASMQQIEATIQSAPLSDNEQQTLLETAHAIVPSDLLFELFLDDSDLSQWISAERLTASAAAEKMENGDLDAIVHIPAGFNYDVLMQLLLGEVTDTRVKLQIEEHSLQTDILYDIMDNYLNGLNLHFALDHLAEGNIEGAMLPTGGRELLNDEVEPYPYTFAQYFTMALSTLFALFIASTIASKTATEKRQRVINRIIITNTRPVSFLFGKVTATFFFTLLQLLFVCVIVHLALGIFAGKSIEFWFITVLIITFFSLTVAGLSAMFTSLMLRMNSINLATGIFTMIIMLLGTLGGSFFPIGEMSPFMQSLVEWTPNGITTSLFIEALQYGTDAPLLAAFSKQFLLFILFLLIGIFLFPERREV